MLDFSVACWEHYRILNVDLIHEIFIRLKGQTQCHCQGLDIQGRGQG